MSVDRRFLTWGVFLVLLGGIPLAVNQGWLSGDSLADAWRLWPLLLVGAGVGLILSRTRFAGLGGVIVAGTFGVILGSLLAGGLSLAIPGCGSGGNLARVDERTGSFDAGPGTVSIEFDCGQLAVGAMDGTGWRVAVDAADPARAPAIEAGATSLSVRPTSGTTWWPFDNRRDQAWQIDLPRGQAIALGATVNAGQARIAPGGANLDNVGLTLNAGRTVLDVEQATVDRLSATVNAGELLVDLPASGTTGSITANAGSVKLCAPAGVGLRLDASGGFASGNNFGDAGLVEQGGAWVSPDYATAESKVDLRLVGNAAGFTLNPPEGCR